MSSNSSIPSYYTDFVDKNSNTQQKISDSDTSNEILKTIFSPTVKPVAQSDTKYDIELLEESFSSKDLKTINDVIAHRTPEQIEKIWFTYKSQTGQNLWDRIKQHLKEPHKNLIMTIAHPTVDRRAYTLFNATTNLSELCDVVTFVLVTSSSQQIEEIKKSLKRMYGWEVDVVLDKISDDLCKLAFYALLEEKTKIDIDNNDARKEAESIYTIDPLTHALSQKLISIFCKRRPKCILKIMKEYEKIAKGKLEHVIKNDTHYAKLIISIVQYTEDPALYIASYLKEGVDRKSLIQITAVAALHFQNDLGHICHVFNSKYGINIYETINKLKIPDAALEALHILFGFA